jgi:[protein-PII] uridylyltransferase
MTIVDARIMPIDNGYSLDTYIFMELDKRMEIDESRLNKIRRSLTRVLTAVDDNVVKVTRPASRQARMFKTTTIVDFSDNAADGRTVLELVTADRPGLLSTVGQTFISHGIDIAAAKIMTIGERAEDVFYIRDLDGKPLGPKAREKLRAALIGELDDNDATV